VQLQVRRDRRSHSISARLTDGGRALFGVR
jgi:hypothetical protein